MENKILIFGKGFIGERLRETFKCDLTSERITSLKGALRVIDRYRPGVIINCIGHIGRNVDDCERDLDKTLEANTFVPIILAEAALRNRIKLVHISSGCIYKFNYKKDKPITEAKLPDFFDLFYSRSKIYSERALEILARKFDILIIRIRVPLDKRPHSRNLLTKLINYKKIINLPNSVTYIPDFVKALRHLIRIEARGIYNVVTKGALEYPELMSAYKREAPDFKYKVIDFKKLGLTRTNLVLSSAKLEKTGFKMRKINEVIQECVKNYIKY